MRDGHACVVYDVNPDAVAALVAEGATGASSLDEFVAGLDTPRHAWIMVPAGEITESTVHDLAARLTEGDTIIDGGNTYYRDDIRRAAELAQRGIGYVDCGTSGGVFGLERGFCLMVGGRDDGVRRARADLRVARPRHRARRSARRDAAATLRPRSCGYLHCGPVGAGHFVKMVHNGIEYGMMAALRGRTEHPPRRRRRPAPARRRTPRRRRSTHPEFYAYDLDLPAIAEVWRRGSVVESWLLDLTAAALHESPTSKASPGASPTRARGAGRRSPRSRRACLPTCSPQRCTRASLPRGGRLREQAALGDAQAVRRATRRSRTASRRTVGPARGLDRASSLSQGDEPQVLNSPRSAAANTRLGWSRSAASTSTSRGPAALGTPSHAPAPMFVIRWLQRIPSSRRKEQTGRRRPRSAPP